MLMSSDIKLDKMKENLESIMKVGLITKSKIITSHYEVAYNFFLLIKSSGIIHSVFAYLIQIMKKKF